MLTYIAKLPFFILLPSFLPSSHRGKFSVIRGETWQKLDFICSLWCFLGKLGDQKGQNLRYILILRVAGAFVVLLSSSFVVAVVVSTGCRWCRLSGLQDLPDVGSGPFVPCSLHFGRFVALLLSCCLQICPYSRFKGVLTGFLLFRVGLLGLGALRGLCGFCTREVFGGLDACGVFACKIILLPFVFFSCPLVLLSSCSPAWLPALPAFCLVFLALWLGFWYWLGCCFFFPCGRLQT